MKGTKEQKGITIIALIITIVVLLILASVAINTIQNDGLIQYAQSTTRKSPQEQIKEKIKLDLNSKVIEKKRQLTDEEIVDIVKSYDKDGKIRDNTYIEIENGQRIDITDIYEFEIPEIILGKEIKKGLNQDEDNLKQYYVYTAEGLSNLNQMMGDGSLGYNILVKIMKDIDFSGYTWNSRNSHPELGFSLKELNGNGHIIKNMTINGQAMFSMLAGSGEVIIRDITFDNAKVNSSFSSISVIASKAYQNTLLENVVVKNSEIIGSYEVAPLIASVYNENSGSSATLTLRNCMVESCTVKATSFDYYTAGMVAYVDKDDMEEIVFEGNNIVKNIKLYAPNNGYTIHANIYISYAEGKEILINTAENVTVENVTFENI